MTRTNIFKEVSVHKIHVSHFIFSEVPQGSSKHVEDIKINLFDEERERAFKSLPTPFFFCSSYEGDAGWGEALSTQLSDCNPPKQKWRWPEDTGTLEYPCKERRQVKSWETQTLKMMGSPHMVLLVMGSPRISGMEKAHFGGRTQQTGFSHRIPCLDAWWATRNKKMSKKHEIGVTKQSKSDEKCKLVQPFLVLVSYQVRAVMKNSPNFHSFPPKPSLTHCLGSPQKGNLCLAL